MKQQGKYVVTITPKVPFGAIKASVELGGTTCPVTTSVCAAGQAEVTLATSAIGQQLPIRIIVPQTLCGSGIKLEATIDVEVF